MDGRTSEQQQQKQLNCEQKTTRIQLNSMQKQKIGKRRK